jgi:hypothetical protein
VTNPINSASSALAGLRSLIGAAQGASSATAGQNLPSGPAASTTNAASAQTTSPSGQFAANTLASLLATQTGQANGAAGLHTHHHHHRKAGSSEETSASEQNSSVSSNTSIAAPTPTSDSPSSGINFGALLQTAAQIALVV